MGAWGGGLYGRDFALDLKGTVEGLWRAPLSEDDLLAELWASHGAGAEGIEALDHWLVLADQFERRGLRRPEVFGRALAIVAAGEDLAALEALGAGPGTLAARARETARLAERLKAPRPARPRRPLAKPQPLLLERGEALAWPTDKGDTINPYLPGDQLWKLGGFAPDGWGFGLVVAAGHQFHALAVYAVAVLRRRRAERPDPALAPHCPRSRPLRGTTTRLHLERGKVERIGRAPEEALGPAPRPGRAAREAVLRGIDLAAAFGLDAWNSWGPGRKFPVPAPSGAPLDPGEPDQRPPPS